MSESDVDNQSLLKHFNEAIVQTVSSEFPSNFTQLQNASGIPEYACLRSLMLEPENPTMWNALALIYLTVGRLEDAEDAIVKSLDINTSNAWTWRIWGDILVMEKRADEAELSFRMALELEPGNPHALYEVFHLLLNRNALIEASDTLYQLLELSPNNQKLWDCYTSCVTNRHRI
ncbi:MAG: hypothetical protein RTU30_11870 [Candidatus Thorarchaeota archaeon]